MVEFLGYTKDGRKRFRGTYELKPDGDPIADYGAVGSGSGGDAYELESTGGITISDTVHVVSSTLAAERYWGGERWYGPIMPPKGSTIDVAYMSIYLYDAANNDANFDIHAQRAAAPVTFAASNFNISSRTPTTAFAAWVEDDLAIGPMVESPSLVSVIQEIVTDYTVSAIVLILRPKTDALKGCYFSNDSYDPPYTARLHLEWTEVGTRAQGDENCYISEINPTTNYNGAAKWGKQTKTQELHWLLRCDFSAEIPAANTITAAYLWLCNSSASWLYTQPASLDLRIQRCLRNWVTGEATYNQYSAGNNWATAGCFGAGDYTTPEVATGGFNSVGWWSINVFTLVEDAQLYRSQVLNIVLHSPTGDLIDETDYSYMTIWGYTSNICEPFLVITHTSPGGVAFTAKVMIF